MLKRIIQKEILSDDNIFQISKYMPNGNNALWL